MQPTKVVLRLGILLALLGLGAWPNPERDRAFGRRVATIANPVLESLRLGGSLSARLEPLDANGVSTAVEEHVVADTALVLKSERASGQMAVGLSLRREVYLPMVLCASLVLIAPLGWRRRALGILVAVVVTLVVGIASLVALVAHLGLHQLPPGVMPSPGWGGLVDFVFERWLAPPGNRVIAPLLLAGVIVLLAGFRLPERGEALPADAPH